MKKLCVFVSLVLLFLSGCNTKDDAGWEVEDFAFYDLVGNLVDYPVDSTLSLEYFKEEDKLLQTKRGVKLFDKAKVVLGRYDLSGFSYEVSCYPTIRPQSDTDKEIDAKFHDKYPDVNEAIKHTSELAKDGLGLLVLGYFYLKDEKLELMEFDEEDDLKQEINGGYEQYEMLFRIVNDEIYEIAFEHINFTSSY